MTIARKGPGTPALDRLQAGLEKALPKLVMVQVASGTRLVALSEQVVHLAAEMPHIAHGRQAVECVAVAVEKVTAASAAVALTIELTALVMSSAASP